MYSITCEPTIDAGNKKKQRSPLSISLAHSLELVEQVEELYVQPCRNSVTFLKDK